MSTVEIVASKAVELVCSSPSQTMIGARLGALLKLEFQDFSPLQFRTRNLRQFVQKFVPGIVESGHTGFDVIFAVVQAKATPLFPDGIVEESRPLPNDFARLPVDIVTWRAYSNPSNPLQVAFNPETSQVRTIETRATVVAPWVVLDKPTSELHRSIAEEFVAAQSDEIKTQLERILALPKWYHQFSTVVKRLNVGPAWATMRIQRLSTQLEEELLAYGTPLNAVKPVKPAVGRDLSQVHSPEKMLHDKALSSDEVRDLVCRLMRHLPIEDLRALRFPLGSIVDALSSK